MVEIGDYREYPLVTKAQLMEESRLKDNINKIKNQKPQTKPQTKTPPIV